MERQSNFELLRIVAMFMILLSHMINRGINVTIDNLPTIMSIL